LPEPQKSITPNIKLAGLIMSSSLFLSRILGMVRDAIMAAMFGANEFTDAYRLSFQIPDLIFSLVAGGALSAAFIPVFSEFLHTGRERDAWKLFSVVVTFMSTVLIVVIVTAMVFAEQLARIVAPGKPEELIPLIAESSRILLPAQFAFFIGGIMFGTLYSRQRFVAPGLGPNIYNIGIIFGALVISNFVSPSVFGMSWGALIGAMIGNLLIPLLVMWRLGSHYRPSLNLKAPGVRKVFLLMAPVVLGLSLPGVYGIILQFYASYLPVGFNTNIDYANRLMQAPIAIFGQAMAIAAFPALAQFFVQNKPEMFRDQLTKTLRTVLYVSIPIAGLMAVFSPEIVRIIYLRGQFTPEDANIVSNCLLVFAIGIPAWCLHPILMRAFFARHQSLLPIVLGTVSTVFFILIVYFGIQGPTKNLLSAEHRYLTLPLAVSLSAIILVVLLCGAMAIKNHALKIRSIVEVLFQSTLAAVVPIALAAVLVNSIHWLTESFVGAVLVTGFGSLGAFWIYYGITRWLKMPETAYLERAAARVSRKKDNSE
jgi:putative peptidoglycan lipid II flippase